MRVFLLDGTYELFRQYYGRPGHVTSTGNEVGAVRGVVGSTVALLEDGATHVSVATDHVIESFRNQLWPGYKTGEGIDPVLFAQFPLIEEALSALGVKVWAMTELEADDALASGAVVATEDETVEQVAILSPDKDLAQCVVGNRIVQVDRRNNVVFDEAGVENKFGVMPKSIPDYLALVGDSADGFPGISGWGAKSTAAVLKKYGTIDAIPNDPAQWQVGVRSSSTLAARLAENRAQAELFKDLATLRVDRSLLGSVEEMRWRGPTADFKSVCKKFELDRLRDRVDSLTESL